MDNKRNQISEHLATTPPKLSPVELYALCEQQEKRIEAKDYRQTLQDLYAHWLFIRPLFESKPLAGLKRFDRFNQELYPYRFSIAQGRYIPRSKTGWRYRRLLVNLKKLQDRELRWLLIARWLKQERVCEPEQFLPDAMLQDLVKKFSNPERFSPADFHGAFLIHAWVPYFEQLKAELSSRKNLSREKEEVARLGYDEKAIGWAFRKHSLIQAICEWLGERKGREPSTLRNIYSRLYSRKADSNLNKP